MHHQETSLSIGSQQVVGAVLKWQRKEKAKTFEKGLTFFFTRPGMWLQYMVGTLKHLPTPEM